VIADIFTSGEPLVDVVSQFLTNYAEDNPASLAELINTVFMCAGCKLEVTEDDISDTENVEGKLADLQDEFQAVSVPCTEIESYLFCASKTSQITPSYQRQRAARTSEKQW
jgi:cohesin complex subunit SA-1/2